MTAPRVHRIAIEGNIGSGKTTLLRGLARRLGARTVLEPVGAWEPWLARMYRDPPRWSFAFNLKVMLSLRTWPAIEALRGCPDVVLYERSPIACRDVFCRVQHRLGQLTDDELALLHDAHDVLGWAPDAVVYLRVPPRVCEARMHERGRSSEAAVPGSYLDALHDAYDDALLLSPAAAAGEAFRVFVVDGSQSSDAVLADVERVVRELRGGHGGGGSTS